MPLRSLLAAALLALLAAAPAASAAPSARAYDLANRFVAKHCPSFDPAALDELAAVFQRTIDKRVHNGRVQIQPIQRYASAMEIATLAEWCKRPGVSRVRMLKPVSGAKTPDMQVEMGGKTVCVEVVSVTGRYPRPWQYRSSPVSRLGGRAPTEKDVARAIDRKINSGQLTSPHCPEGGTISLNVAERGGSRWKPISGAFKDRAQALNGAQHVKSVEVRSGSTRLDVVRNAQGQAAVSADPRVDRRYQRALTTMRGTGLPVVDRGGLRGAPMRAPGLSPGDGGFSRALARGLGGIDFSSLELRYVADRRGKGLRYAFRGRPGAGGDPATGLDAAQDASDAFFVWLALNPAQFWVNLNPTEPNRIIDPAFARSDAGRVLLEADLALKKVVAPLVRPDTGPGVQFWRELEALYGERPDQACFSVRQWIVPDPATVYEDRDELYILQAPLRVMMESEFIGGFPGGGCPQGNQAFEDAKEEIYRRLILPLVTNAVNTDPAFADLRRVYLSRVAAEWFRARHGQDATAIGRLADSGDVSRWPAQAPWNPIDVFNRYLESVRNGEWSVDRRVVVDGREYILNTVYGGVDFSQTPKANVARPDFRARWPKLDARVKRSVKRSTANGEEVWLGGSLR